jgi:hypothetical protein
VFAVVTATTASANELTSPITSGTSTGRAGVTTVSGDLGAALERNPASLSRRGDSRARVGAIIRDHDASFAVPDSASPDIRDRGGAIGSPDLSAAYAIGDWIIAAGLLELAHTEHELTDPAFGQPAEDITRIFPHRYGGTSFAFDRRALLLGASIRAAPWLAVGASVGIESTSVSERRHLWAGFGGRDVVGSPERDLSIELSGQQNFTPRAALGVLVAPLEVPIEIAVAGEVVAPAEISGPATLDRIANTSPQLLVASADSALALPGRISAHVGARYQGERFSVEANVSVRWVTEKGASEWEIDGLSIEDESTAQSTISNHQSAIWQGHNASLGIAGDAVLIEDFLSLTWGYLFTSAASPRASLRPTFMQPDNHTLAIGAEGYWSGVTVSIGYARTLFPDLRIHNDEAQQLLDNPFDAGTLAVGVGTYERSTDIFGISAELGWE